MEFWILILVLFFATNLLDKAESVQLEELEELPLQTFDELFVDEWWDKDEAAEDLKRPPTNFGQNVHHQIERQNTQIGQIEPNSTDQLGQIEPNSTNQNLPLTESDHFDNAEDKRKPSKHKHSHSEQKELLKRYYEIKVKNSKISDGDIAKMLNIGSATLNRWKKQFKRQQFHPNSVDGHSVEENAAAYVQEIGCSNSRSI
uniref:Uncharacterized protein n=1 Tax=Globodera rostochiensis TaxID=31243 RepID=A0A914H2H8_GLORO